MEPDVRYCTTEDGVRIAYTVTGTGPPLVWVADLLASHVQGEWSFSVLREYYSGVIRSRTLVRFDQRGLGLSDRDVNDLSLDSRVRDMEAVADSLRLGEFTLMGDGTVGGWVAVTYTVRHPERVSHLILQDCSIRASDLTSTPNTQTLAELLVRNWEMFTENLGSLSFGWADPQAREFGKFIRACVTERTAKRSFAALAAADVSSLLPSIQSPTLVLCHTAVPGTGVDMARDLAALTPDARIRVIDGGWGDNIQDVLSTINEFLGDADEAQAGTAPSGLVTILFTDIEGSTGLSQSLGDSRAQELLRAHNAIVREALKAQGGSEIKHTGDGIMAWFPLASSAVKCAITIQRAFDSRAREPGETSLRVRIGLNAGEPVIEDDDLFGTAVQLAARICTHAKPGQILASNVVRELAAGKGLLFSGQRDVALKGFEDLVRLCEVRWRPGDAGGPPLAIHEQLVALTARETEVLGLLAGGRSGKEIAAELSVSLSTVQRHIANLYAKIGARGRVEAAAYALARGLAQPRGD